MNMKLGIIIGIVIAVGFLFSLFSSSSDPNYQNSTPSTGITYSSELERLSDYHVEQLQDCFQYSTYSTQSNCSMDVIVNFELNFDLLSDQFGLDPFDQNVRKYYYQIEDEMYSYRESHFANSYDDTQLLIDLPENLNLSASGINAINCDLGDKEACERLKENPYKPEFMVQFDKLAEMHSNELRDKYPEAAIAGDEIVLMKQQGSEEYLNYDTSDWYEIYSKCVDTPVKYFEGGHVRKMFCTEILELAITEMCPESIKCTYRISIEDQAIIGNGVTYNTQTDLFDKVAEKCSYNNGSYAPLEDVKDCVCKDEIDSTGWDELCKKDRT